VDAPIPQSVVLALRSGTGEPVAALVKRGEAIKAGQIVARDDATVSSPLIAPINGVVAKATTGEIVIQGDATPAWQKLDGSSPAWKSLPAEQIERLLYLSGTTALAASGIPTRFHSAAIAPSDVEHVIVAACEGGEPFAPSIPLLLAEGGAERLYEGLAILRAVMPEARFHLAVSRATIALLDRGRPDWLRTVLVASKFPQAHEAILTRTVLREPFPYGYEAINIGVVVLDVQAVLQARDAVVAGKPLIERCVALAGPGFASRPHVRARIGTSIGDLVRAYANGGGSRLILGSALSGESIEHPARPVDCRSSLVIALPEGGRGLLGWSSPGFRKDSYSRTFVAGLLPLDKLADTGLHGELRPCINCNYCDQVCPVGILPQVLHRYVRRNLIEDVLARYRIFDCIDCHLCTYVCPSKIPVAELLARGKRTLRDEGLDPARDARTRFRLKGVVTEGSAK